MDIVLDATFNNPRLPVVTLPGFTDDFNRPNGALGTTTDGKPWEYSPPLSTSVNWSIDQQRAGVAEGSGNRFQLAHVDAGIADGTLTAELAHLDPVDLRTGLAVRVQDEQNYISVLLGVGTTTTGMRIQSRINSSATNNVTDSTPISAGDTIAVTTTGPLIEVRVNDALRLTATIPELTDATRHGFYSYAGARIWWDSIKFEPA